MLSRENMFVTNIIKITEDTEKLRTKTFIAQKLITHKNINRRTSYKIYHRLLHHQFYIHYRKPRQVFIY